MFTDLLFELRRRGVGVGLGEWIAFLEGLSKGLATDSEGLYGLGRSVLCRSEAEYDAFDLAFLTVFGDAEIPADLKRQLEEWLANARSVGGGPWVDHSGAEIEELLRRLEETLRAQKDAHHGGNRWVGTGGTSPYGHSGRARNGLRVGGEGTGGRTGVRAALERRWANYRTDRVLDVRDYEVALRELRSLAREGAWTLDLDETIDRTAKNAGEITLTERRERVNRLKVVLLMDAGGSMAPHAARVEQLFSAARRLKTFKSFEHYYFHNCVYRQLYVDFERFERMSTHDVLSKLTPQHRLIFVGDASMAPYELFGEFGWAFGETSGPSGLDWLRRFRSRSPASVWLNPDPVRFWSHTTVSAIGQVFPMFPLSVDGLRRAVRTLRAPI